MPDVRAPRLLPPGWRWVKLGEVCEQDRSVVGPRSTEAVKLPYLGLEDIESDSGRVLKRQAAPLAEEGISTTFRFDSRHVLYGKLRPYLNKVALPDFEGRYTTEMIPLLPRQCADRRFLAWLLRREETVDVVMREKTGARMPRADMDVLLAMAIPLPPLPEQRRIARILKDQMQQFEKARKATEAQLEAARALPASYLREVFASEEAKKWPRKNLEEVATLLAAGSLAEDGDTEVLAVTTACLTEAGFNPAGTKRAQMASSNAAVCALSEGEVLVARSNTPELVGRAAVYEGNPPDVVASDLTIRVQPSTSVLPGFLGAFLSWLYATGYWRNVAGGVSGSMKKIRRSQLMALAIPVPLLSEQRRTVGVLNGQVVEAEKHRKVLEDQLKTINKLPAALLRKAFAGEV